MQKDLHPATQAIHSVQQLPEDIRPVVPALYLSTTYRRNEDGGYNHGFVYSRAENPNRQLLEQSLAQLEGGAAAFTFGSGMAAVTAVFQSLRAGDHLLLPDDAYYNVQLLLREVFADWGLTYTPVDMAEPAAVAAALRPNTRLIWLETPSNPLLKITDIRAIVELAQAHGCLVAVDNTWPTPVLQKPLDLGADIVMHSTTKYFGGHSDVLGGCVVVREQGELATRLRRIQVLTGGVPSPFDAWLVARGIQTLHLRVGAQSHSAAQLAAFLASHPGIERVNYPGLPDHPGHTVASQQMQGGFGGMLSVQIRGDRTAAVGVSNRLRLFTTATSLGGVESLVEHRRSVEGPDSQTPDNLLRLSVGLENTADLLADWEQALQD